MTLAAIWIESRDGDNQQLCFASDSRTTPGPIEGVTKVVLFGREDLAAAWAGDFRYASIVANHLDAVFTTSEAMRRRDIDVAVAFRRAVTAVQEHLDTSITPAVPHFELNAGAQEPERTSIVVGGYSITESAFKLLRLDWVPASGRRWRVRVETARADQVVFLGDRRKWAHQVIRRARRLRGPDIDTWRMEPLAAIHMACWDPKAPTIGGRLQLAKAYIHGSARSYGFVDPMHDDGVWVRGTRIDSRAVKELAMRGLLVDIGSWRTDHGMYGSRRRV